MATTFGTSRRLQLSLLLICILCGVSFGIGIGVSQHTRDQQPLGSTQGEQKPLTSKSNSTTFLALLDALDVLQEDYFALWQGMWPKSIDWTSAVIGTYLSAALTSLSTSSSFESSKSAENLVNKYFSQLIASYFGQDAFALRQEAYDDMLWVVLGWLESIKFINTHSKLHYGTNDGEKAGGSWHGEQWIPPFAHRARLFWDMASKGWDTSLCNGGMIWSPYLVPYKNAITNELYITASISMYLYFPGDDNTSPFGLSAPRTLDERAIPHDPKYLAAAIHGYRWLSNSNMTDSKGLYVDGYHISGWSREQPKNGTGNTRCDARNEMVYTYNQGVLLSGQRGLYEATGARSYLEDGHKLVSDVITATGWDTKYGGVIDSENDSDGPRSRLGKWHGLGRSGILEEACDAPGFCSQDSQTFKGIFFQHLTNFCSRLPDHLVIPKETFLTKTSEQNILGGLDEVRTWHNENCAFYAPWIKHNAEAALTTLDTEGRFGMWWGAPPHSTSDPAAEVIIPDSAVDYRNQGLPPQWKDERKYRREVSEQNEKFSSCDKGVRIRDLNDRGRGRTVETQGGGLSVLRARWEVVDTR